MNTQLKEILTRFSSRKFLLAVLGLVTVFFVELTPEQTSAITNLILAFTVAEDVVDVVRSSK